MASVIGSVVTILVWIAAITIGILAFYHKPNQVFGSAPVFHILFGVFMPPLELILGSIELAS